MPREDLIQVRRDTAADWTAANPVLAAGELGLESDTNQLKAGDGVTAWNALPYTTSSGTTVAAGSHLHSGSTDPEAAGLVDSGDEYVWLKTDGNGVLLDILSGVAD